MLQNKTTNNFTLSNIAGYEEEKAEAIKIINLFKNYDKLREFGVHIPKGLILSGLPGVGKTLMAKVIANESKVPFYEFECSEDDTPQKIIANLKKLYEEARNNAPSIVLIDELDELVSSDDYVTDFSRTMLKGLLTELDGVKNSEGVLTIATTNYYERLPGPLLRSGRMDKHINFELPDFDARKAILKLYTTDKQIINNIDFDEVAARTSSFSGADLKTLVNETIIETVNSGKEIVTSEDFYLTIPNVLFKGIKKNVLNEAVDHICYHELGHFICEYVLNKNIAEISVERIGNVGGHIHIYQVKDIYNNESYEYCKNKAIVLLGGYAAEKIFMGQTYTGVSNDFTKYSRWIETMCSCGMLGSKYIFDELMIKNIKYGNDTSSRVEVKEKCFNEHLAIAEKIINDNRDLILFLFNHLKEQKKLEPKNIEVLISKFEEIR